MKKVLGLLFLVIAINLFANGAMVINSISQTLSNVSDLTNNGSNVNNTFATLGETAGSAPNKMAFYQNNIYVAVTYGNSIQKINAITGESSYIYLESGSMPNDIIIDNENSFAYVTGNGTNKVYKINLVTNEVVSSIDVGVAPQGLAINNGKLYVANTAFNSSDYSYGDGTVSVIQLSDFSSLQTLSITYKNPILVKVAENHIFVICMGDWSGESEFGVEVFNEGETAPAHSIALFGGHPSAASLFLGYDMRALYVGSTMPSGVWVINPDTYEVTTDIADSPFEGGSSLDVYDNILVTVDPLDWQSNSIVRSYNVITGELIGTWETAVGATDIKIYTDLLDSSDSAIQSVNFSIGQPYPNPFYQKTKGSIAINYYSAKNGILNCDIYNMKGQKVTSFTKNTDAGDSTILWNPKDKSGKDISSGVYYFKIVSGKKSAVKKITVIK